MTITKTEIVGNLRIEVPVFEDYRGLFEVFWEQVRLAEFGIQFRPCSAHHSYNRQRGTMRAFHFQEMPYGQTKLVTCVSGRVWDVAADVTPGSPTFGKWAAVELNAGSGRSHLIPPGCAHGFVSLEDHSTVAYLIEGEYRPDASRVVRWDDSFLAVAWPVANPILSEKDATAPLLKP